MYSREDEARLREEVEFWENYIADWKEVHGSEPTMQAYALLAQARVRLESCRQWLRICENGKEE